MKVLRRALGAAALVLCLGAGTAKADTLPPQWSFQWTPNATFKVFADKSTTDYIQATPQPANTFFGDATIPAFQLTTATASTTTIKNPSTFTNAGFSVSLTLFDQASGKSATLPFSGVFNGQLWNTQANLRFTPTSGTQSVKIGGNTYTVKLDVANPGGPNSGVFGAITGSAQVNVVSQSPEPSALALAGLGLGGLGCAGWLRRRARRAAPVAA
jgi:hypothetical protein